MKKSKKKMDALLYQLDTVIHQLTTLHYQYKTSYAVTGNSEIPIGVDIANGDWLCVYGPSDTPANIVMKITILERRSQQLVSMLAED